MGLQEKIQARLKEQDNSEPSNDKVIEAKVSLFTNLKILFIVVLQWLLISIYSGFVMCKLYQWFVSSTYNVPVIGIVQAMGLIFIFEYINFTSNIYNRAIPLKDEADPYYTKRFKKRLALNTGFLFIGYIISLYL